MNLTSDGEYIPIFGANEENVVFSLEVTDDGDDDDDDENGVIELPKIKNIW
jgi:hypothetical protein